MVFAPFPGSAVQRPRAGVGLVTLGKAVPKVTSGRVGTMRRMSQRTTRGRAVYGDSGEHAADVIVIEELRERRVRVPGATGYKDGSGAGQSYVVFEQIHSDELRARLQQLVDAAGDVELGRRLRDSGQSRVVVYIVLEDGRDLQGCSIARPIDYFGELETLEFLATLDAVPRP